MNLDVFWFVIIAVLFVGYFFLEGFDFGVGMLLPFIGKTDTDRRVMINSIGPFWDGNEVWLITAGGALFAAFPNWYATLFSGFYLALFIMLLALIARGVAFEFRGKENNRTWRAVWDWLIVLGSAGPAFLWGVALADMMQGVPINASMNYVGTFFNLLSPFSVIMGAAMVMMFILHGALFLSMKTTGDVKERAQKAALRVGGPTTTLLFIVVILSYFYTDIFRKMGIDPGPIPIVAGLALLSVRYFIGAKRYGWAFIMTGITIALSTITVFLGLFPRVMVSSLNPNYSLTIYNAASNHYSLVVMTIVALTLVPVVLAYQIWSYWVFKKRVSPSDHLDY
ncbi:cytochrome d ubiquinol oxidase subunit II [Sulfoacidibacillus ferrooxidans]|uniref:Cytochrome bd-I ubiquinol oxidase subunit 2 n=1 Tax=Sulfoacidibacillus ferrooxidans TaxID=2005001 RepID=A0A9X1V7B8_9BACL|nr:cytochrome d ubiquinol oxidase subunit II [Sulfoacidibacillus ferrooxidans]MCI0182871.1 Cytochrome bd-I ubiquinol oxidase subunit 2 [Sulfoacidibacillus ferrooxidans]